MQAFLAASMKSDAELADWFRERLVWDNTENVVEMLKSGLFVRAYEPQVSLLMSLAALFPSLEEHDSDVF